MRFETVEVLLVCCRSEAFDLRAFGRRLEQHAKDQPRLASLLRQGCDELELRPRDMVKDDTLRRHDLAEDAVVWIVDAVGAVHGEPPGAARPQVEFVERGR